MRKKIFAVVQYLIFLGIGIFLSYWQFSKMTPGEKIEFKESLLHANYIVILPICVMAIASHISRAMRWKLMIEPMGYEPRLSNTFYSVMCGYFANTFIPRAGEILRCTLLGRYEKIPINKLLGTIVTERIFDILCFIAIFIFTILIQMTRVGSFIKRAFQSIGRNNSDFPWMALLAAFAVSCLVIAFIIKWIFKKYKTHRHVIKIKSILSGLKEGFTSIIHLKKRKAFLLHTCFIWAMYLLQIYIGFNALQATSGLGMPAALSILSLSTVAMIIAPGGVGAFPVGMQEVLLIYNIQNISFGWLMWGTTTGIVIVAGAISFALLIFNNRKRNETIRENSRKNLYN